MTIELVDVCKTTRINRRPFALLDGLNLRVEQGEHVGILGLTRTGKTTLLRILSGVETMDSGMVRNDETTSWLIPEIGFLMQTSSIAWNVRWLARMYGIKRGDFARDVGELAGITEYLNRPVRECPRTVRQQLAVYVALAMPFGLYLFDDAPVTGRGDEREAAANRFRDVTKGKTFVIATDTPQALDGLCDSIYVLESGRAKSFATCEDALEYFKKLQKSEKERKKTAADTSDEDDSAAAVDEADTMDQVAVAASDF